MQSKSSSKSIIITMKNTILAFIAVLLFTNCQQKTEPKKSAEAKKDFTTLSYLDIKLDENGHLPSNPYVLKFKNGKKEIVFCGVEHATDNSNGGNQMYATLEQKFFDFHPDIAVNEGGDISENTYSSKKEALSKDGEIGLIKVLSDSLKIKTINGDPDVEYEFNALLQHYTKGEFLAYIVTERLMWGLHDQQISDVQEIKKRYQLFLENYIIKKGKVALQPIEKTFDFYQKNYQQLVGRAFGMNDLKPTNPFDAKGKFQEIGRKSKIIRDQYLLKTIDQLLNTHDKVFVVFGGWHLLTCQPGLKEVIERKR